MTILAGAESGILAGVDVNQCRRPSVADNASMTTFDDERERAFERKMALDQELAFRVAARRNSLLAHWAAGRMGLSGQAAEDYAAGLVAAGAVHTGSGPTVAQVAADLLARGIPARREEVESHLQRFTAKARAEIVRGALR